MWSKSIQILNPYEATKESLKQDTAQTQKSKSAESERP